MSPLARSRARPLPSVLVLALLALPAPAFAAAPRFRSDGIVGSHVTCTEPEKLCFHFNRLLSSPDGRCLPLGTPCDVAPHVHLEGKLRLFVNRTESNVHNRFRATCRKTYCEEGEDANRLCPAPFVSFEDVRRVCGNLPIYNNMFDDLECLCPQCRESGRVAQPSEAGKCAVPNLWRSYRGADGAIAAPCSDEELLCFREGKVPFGGGCWEPLRQGPCGEGQWLALDEALYGRDGQLRAACAARRCPGAQEVWMAFSGRCHPREEVAARVCVGGSVLREDAFGRADCVPPGGSPFGLPSQREGEQCRAPPPPARLVEFRAALECEIDADGSCRD